MAIPKKIKLSDFKCFPMVTGGAEIELRPLTLFYGYNNSGKSALLRGITLVIEALSNPAEDLPLPLKSPVARGTDFESLLSFEESSMEIEAWNDQGTRFGWVLRNMPEYHRHVVDVFFAEDSNDVPIFRAEADPEKSRYEQGSLTYKVLCNGETTEVPDLSFGGLRTAVATDIKDEKIRSALEAFDSIECDRPVWLSSNRTFQKRQFEKGSGSIAIQPDGEGIEQLLFRAQRSQASEAWYTEVQSWFREHFSCEIYVEPAGKNFSLTLGRIDEPYRVNLYESGQGLQEIVPIVCALYARADEKFKASILAIEEPESHLHPMYHPILGSLFARMAQQSKGEIILTETHSENLLLRVQLEIAKGNLEPDKVIVYWLRQSASGATTVEPVEFDELGRPTPNWPPKVFSTDLDQSRELLKHQRDSKEA